MLEVHAILHRQRCYENMTEKTGTLSDAYFPNDTALEKLVYLAYRNIRKKWTMPLANWGIIAQQVAIKFGDRFKLL